MPEPKDPMTLTLDALRRDVERTPLADSPAVRRRGDRRTRHQAVGASLAAVALVAGVIGVSSGLLGHDDRANGPIASHPPTASARAIAPDPFLVPRDLVGLGSYDEIGAFIDANEEPTVQAEECRLRPSTWDADQTRATRFYQDGSEATLYEYVLRYSTASEAQAALEQPPADLATCPSVDPSEGTLETREEPAALGDLQVLRTSRAFTPTADSEPSYYEAAVVQDGNLVVVLDWSASANPGAPIGLPWTLRDAQLQAAVDRAVR